MRTITRSRLPSAVAAVFVLATVAGGCGGPADGPPRIEIDRTACAHCGMLVSERAYAAAYRRGADEAKVFDDIGCLLAAVRREPEAHGLRFWFHDAPTAAWIDGREAVFVASPGVRTPMGGGLAAYRDAQAARDATAAHQGVVVGSLDLLLKREES